MKFNRNEAKALTNAKELDLYDTARAPRLNKLSVKELKNLVKRSRTLRDKLLDKKRSQVRSNQASSNARGVGAADRSGEKAELFAEVHVIFVARLSKIEADEARAKEKAAKKSVANKPLASAAGGKGSGARSRAATRSAKATQASKAAINPGIDTIQKPQEAARKKDPVGKVEQERIARSGITKQRGHISSVTKRRQAKRDSK